MVIGIVMVVAGALTGLVGALGWIGRLPRNRWAGVRTPATLRSDEAFRTGNRAAGPLTVVGGVAALAGGVLAMVVPARDAVACVLVGAFLGAGLTVLGGLIGGRAANAAHP
jgi:uncharacterized membrane protein